LTSTKDNFLVGVPGVSSAGQFRKSRDVLIGNLVHSDGHKQAIYAGFKHYFGHCYQLFSRLRIDQQRPTKQLVG